MAKETEIERLVVRLVGNNKEFKRMMQDSVNQAVRSTRKIKQATSTMERGITGHLNRVGRKFEGLSRKLSTVGRKLSMFITAPLVGLGALATREAATFETSMAKIVGLVGIEGSKVQEMSKGILDMAGNVGKGPAELAEALFFITSGGLRGADAMEALEISAKASAVGMGETKDVADAVTSAMNAYGKENLNATRATEILTAAVRAGKADAASFGPVMGQLLPMTNHLGVSFSEVAGTLAFLTKTTGSASLAATGYKGVLRALNKPVESVVKLFKELAEAGETTYTLDRLRDAIGKKGLHPAVMELKDELEKLGIPLSKFFTDSEGLVAALQMTGGAAQDAADTIAAVGDSVGIVDDATKAMADTMGQKWAVAAASWKVQLITIGGMMAPIVEKITAWTTSTLEWFRSLSAGSKQVIIWVAAIAATVGPAILILSKLAMAVKTVTVFTIASSRAWRILRVVMLRTIGTAKLLRIALLGVKATLVVIVGLSAFKVTQWLSGATADVNKFNEGLRESKRLLDKTFGVRYERQTELKTREITGVGGEAGNLARVAHKHLSSATRDVGVYEAEIESLNRTIKESEPTWRSLYQSGKAEWELNKHMLTEAEQKLAAAQKRVDAIQAAIAGVAGKVKEEEEKAERDSSARQLELAKQWEGVDKFISGLKLQTETMLMTADAAELYRQRLAGAAGDQIAQIEHLQELRAELQKELDLRQKKADMEEAAARKSKAAAEALKIEAKALVESLKTPMQKYADLVTKRREMLGKGLLTDTQFEDSLKVARAELEELLEEARDEQINVPVSFHAISGSIVGSAEALARMEAQDWASKKSAQRQAEQGKKDLEKPGIAEAEGLAQHREFTRRQMENPTAMSGSSDPQLKGTRIAWTPSGYTTEEKMDTLIDASNRTATAVEAIADAETQSLDLG